MHDVSDLALETRLLLQEVQCNRPTSISPPTDTEKLSSLLTNDSSDSRENESLTNLVSKLRKQKAEMELKQQERIQNIYKIPMTLGRAESIKAFSQATKIKPNAIKPLPVAASMQHAAKSKKAMLQRLKNQAILQGNQEMAKVFGYASYEEQLFQLRKKEENKFAASNNRCGLGDVVLVSRDYEVREELFGNLPQGTECEHSSVIMCASPTITDDEKSEDKSVASEENISDSESEAKDESQTLEENASNSDPTRDKAPLYRALLQKESNQAKKNKNRGKLSTFVESEAEEEEEENALKIGGLNDFGFGVPKVLTEDEKQAEEEKKALDLQDDDLHGIVDELSDDEVAQEQDIEEMFRKEQETIDRKEVRQVMQNVKEGFGRNRRVFSSSSGHVRGRFHLDELVAADGDRHKAAELGLLESDEELSDNDVPAKDDEAVEEDEELEMERTLRDRFLNQPKIYITSSESESDGGVSDAEKGHDKEKADSDEEQEREQIKLFSERAKVNRRIRRMRTLQREKGSTKRTQSSVPKVSGLHALNGENETLQLTQALKGTNATDRVAKQLTCNKNDTIESGWSYISKSRSVSSFTRVLEYCNGGQVSGNSAGDKKAFAFMASTHPDDVEKSEQTRKVKQNKYGDSQKTRKRQKSEFLSALESYHVS